MGKHLQPAESAAHDICQPATQREQFTQLRRLHNYTGNKMQSKAVAVFFFFPPLLSKTFTRKHSGSGFGNKQTLVRLTFLGKQTNKKQTRYK